MLGLAAQEASCPSVFQSTGCAPAGLSSALCPPPCLCSEGPALLGVPLALSHFFVKDAVRVGNRSTSKPEREMALPVGL